MSRYLFKQTTFEKEIADVTGEFKKSVEFVLGWIARYKEDPSSVKNDPLDSADIFDPLTEKLYSNNLRAANYALSSHQSTAPVNADYDDLPEIEVMEDDLKISTFHTWCRTSPEDNLLLPLLQLLEQYLPAIQYFDQNAKGKFERAKYGIEAENETWDPGHLLSEKDTVLVLAQLLWNTVHLVMWLYFPENQDTDYVKDCLEHTREMMLTEEDMYESDGSDEPPSIDELATLIKINYTDGWDYMKAEILRHNILFPLSNPGDKHALFRSATNPQAPCRNPDRNLISLLFDYQLLAPWTSQKRMASRWGNHLSDLYPEGKYHYSLQHHLKRIVVLLQTITCNPYCAPLLINGAGLLVQLHNHWNKVLTRFNLREQLTQHDYTSAASKQAAEEAATQYQKDLDFFIVDQKDLLSEDDDDPTAPPDASTFALAHANASCYENLSQIVFCIYVLLQFAEIVNSYLLRPDGSNNDVTKLASRSKTPNVYPTIISRLPDYDGVAKGKIDFDDLRRWGSPEGDIDQAFFLYPEQDKYYVDLFIFQAVTYTKTALLLYKSLHISAGHHDWFWKNYTTASIATAAYNNEIKIGTTLFKAIDILFSAVIRTGGFVANRVLFNLLFDEDKLTEIKPVAIKTDAELYEEMKSQPKINGTHFAMTPVLPLATDQFDLTIGLADEQLPDTDVLTKTEMLERQSKLVQDKVDFSHSFIDLILQKHLEDSQNNYFVPKYDKHNVFEYDFQAEIQPFPLTYPVPSLIFFTSSILFGTANQSLFTYEKRYQALYRYLLLEQRLGLLMEQAMLTFSDVTKMNLLDKGGFTHSPNWSSPSGGDLGKITSHAFILAIFAQGLDAYRHANYDKCGIDAMTHPSLRVWTDPVALKDLPMELNTLSNAVHEWKISTTDRQTQYRNGEFIQELVKQDPKTNFNPVFPYKFIDSYRILNKEQLQNAYKAHYDVQMELFHHTNIWSIFSFLMEQQYQLRNLFVIKNRAVKQLFATAKLTGVPIPVKQENLGHAIYFNEDDVLPDAKEGETDSDSDKDEDASDDEEVKEPPYVFTGLPKTRLYNWLYIKGQMTRCPDDFKHEQSDLYVTDGFSSEQAKEFSFESPAMLSRADQVVYGRRFVSEGELDDNSIIDIVLKTIRGYAKHIGDMLRSGVAVDVVQPKFDLVKSFLVTMDRFNVNRSLIFRLLQTASMIGWSTNDEPLIELMTEVDFVYKQIIKNDGEAFDKDIVAAAIFQRSEFLSAFVQGAANLSFATPYGKPEEAWAHYYPKVDLDTGEEELNSSFVDDDVKNDGPWSTWQDMRKLTILKMRIDCFDNDGYNDLSKAINASYPLLRLIGKLKEGHDSDMKEWAEELKQEVDNDFILDHGLLLDKPKKKKKYSWESDSDSDSDDDEPKVVDPNAPTALTLVPLAVQSPAFMTQFAIEAFIDMMLEGNTNTHIASTLDTIDFGLKMESDVVDAPWVEVTAANSQEVFGNPFPVQSKMVAPKQPIRFGFHNSAANPFKKAEFKHTAIVAPAPVSNGIPVYSKEEQLQKYNKLAASLAKQLDQKF